jgi:hypothetical protein
MTKEFLSCFTILSYFTFIINERCSLGINWPSINVSLDLEFYNSGGFDGYSPRSHHRRLCSRRRVLQLRVVRAQLLGAYSSVPIPGVHEGLSVPLPATQAQERALCPRRGLQHSWNLQV